MDIIILATGKSKDKEINTQVDAFIKRLKPHFPTKVIEIQQAKGNTPEEIKLKEAEAQLAKIPAGATIVAMDERGDLVPSLKFAKKLGNWKDSGVRTVVPKSGW